MLFTWNYFLVEIRARTPPSREGPRLGPSERLLLVELLVLAWFSLGSHLVATWCWVGCSGEARPPPVNPIHPRRDTSSRRRGHVERTPTGPSSERRVSLIGGVVDVETLTALSAGCNQPIVSVTLYYYSTGKGGLVLPLLNRRATA